MRRGLYGCGTANLTGVLSVELGLGVLEVPASSGNVKLRGEGGESVQRRICTSGVPKPARMAR